MKLRLVPLVSTKLFLEMEMYSPFAKGIEIQEKQFSDARNLDFK